MYVSIAYRDYESECTQLEHGPLVALATAYENATVPLRFKGSASTVRHCLVSTTTERSKLCPYANRRLLPRQLPLHSFACRSSQPLRPALYCSVHWHWVGTHTPPNPPTQHPPSPSTPHPPPRHTP